MRNSDDILTLVAISDTQQSTACNMIISVLLTCFNRREHTLECLRSMARQNPCGATLHYYLVDDGSTDGTAETVAREFPDVRILQGDGSLYWCGGMRLAWQTAVGSDPDYYLLLNDDTHLYPTALATLLDITKSPESEIIAVGAICDAETGIFTYGGIRRFKGSISPTGKEEICDTFHANCVIIPRAVYLKIGTLHHRYTHGMGDFDYGLQATMRGMKVIQSAEFIGTCSSNPVTGTWRDRNLSRRARWCLLNSKKTLPFLEWMEFNRRNSGIKWPLYTISPWIQILLKR